MVVACILLAASVVFFSLALVVGYLWYRERLDPLLALIFFSLLVGPAAAMFDDAVKRFDKLEKVARGEK